MIAIVALNAMMKSDRSRINGRRLKRNGYRNAIRPTTILHTNSAAPKRAPKAIDAVSGPISMA